MRFQLSSKLGKWLKGFGEDANGEIYVLDSSNLGPAGTTGAVFEITAVPEPTSVVMLLGCGILLRRRNLRPAL